MNIDFKIFFGRDGPPMRKEILQLNLNGRFAINVVDNLIVVHHQTSQTSLIFDIKLVGNEVNGFIVHNAIVPPYTIKPFKIDDVLECELCKFKEITTKKLHQGFNLNLFSDAPSCVIFQPDIIIDAR